MSSPTYVFPLSFAQQRLWFLSQLNPGSAFYNIDLAQRWSGEIDTSALERSINAIVRRHEVLRTAFRIVDGEPRQVVLPELTVPLRLHDVSALGGDAREAEIVRLATVHAKEPFDLGAPPLLRASLVRVSDSESVFMLTLHHIIADGWSMTIFGQELAAFYGAYLQEVSFEVPDLPIQYADFAVWQREHLAGAALDRLVSYWRKQLEGAPPLRLPTDRPRRSPQNFAGASIRTRIDAELTQQLRALSQHENVTLFMTMVAAFQVLLHRITGQDDIVIGSPVANRNRPEVEPLIGFFVNALVLRTKLGPELTFREVLQRVRNVAVEAYGHQELPFEKLVEELHPGRTAGVNPIFQVSFQLFSTQYADFQAVDESTLIPVERATANIDLALDFADASDSLVCRTEYSTELYDAATIRQWLACYEQLLRAVVTNPDGRVSDFALLPMDTERRLLEQSTAVPPQITWRHALDAIVTQCAARPSAIAAVFEGQRLTYEELDTRSTALARFLVRDYNVTGKTVAVLLPNSLDVLVTLLAVWKAGAVYLPLNPQDPTSRRDYILRDSAAALVITTETLASSLPFHLPRVTASNQGDPPATALQRPPAGVAYVIYTSGTTGRPKGVMVSHQALAAHLECMQQAYPLTAVDIGVLKYSLSFDVSVFEMLSPLVVGATLHIVPTGLAADTRRFVELLRRSGATVLDVVPSMLEALLGEPEFGDCKALRRIICGGEAFRVELLERTVALFGRQPIQILNMYGPTEATITATVWEWRPGAPCGAVVPIGRPLPGVSCFVLDDALRPQPPMVPGELYVSGQMLADGYLNQPELTRDRFLPVPWDPGARMYRTGDIVRVLADGALEFIGRVDEQVKLRGYRVELGDIEATLSEHRSVRECAVALRENNDGEPSLAAFVVRNEEQFELWPSIGEYFVYDDLMYFAMTNDERRNRAYRRAIERHVKDKVVIDLGTGADALLARMCADAGARRVYAIEMLDHACEQARRTIRQFGLSDRVEVIHGTAANVQLPEPADVCVSELIGTIGSSEGVVSVLNDARRLLKRDGVMIPQRCITRIAAATLPAEIWANPRFSDMTRHYTNQVFGAVGRPFDVRVCVKNFPETHVLSDAGVFEDLTFAAVAPTSASHHVRLHVRRAGRLDGFVLWINLLPGGDEEIDSLRGRYSWLPVFFPVFYPGTDVAEDDVLDVTCEAITPEGGWLPDYVVHGQLLTASGRATPFSYRSAREPEVFKANEFYRRLFADEARLSDEHSVQIARWRETYDEIYAPVADGRSGFHTNGWDSSYTGEPLSAAEMEEQVAATAARIARLGGRRILEIGCGTGLLLFRLASDCLEYHGVDFSAAALDAVRRQLNDKRIPSVRLTQASADDFSAIEPQHYDVVVLNSVVQYFPDTAYLQRVLDGALRATRPGGFVFVGDVRSRALLETFRTSVELATASELTPLSVISERVTQRAAAEQELYLHPALFARAWNAGAIEVQLKRGRHDNELTRFRYDVTLSTSSRGSPQPVTVPWTDVASVESLVRAAQQRNGLLVTGIPNARLTPHTFAQHRLATASPSETAGRLKRELPSSGIHPEDVWQACTAAGVDATLSWSLDGRADTFDVLLREPSTDVVTDFGSHYTVGVADEALANAPARLDSSRSAAAALTGFLRSRLPDYMVPRSFTFVDALPQLPNGKVDRTALASLDIERPVQRARVFTPPATPTQRKLAGIWCELLGMDNIGVHDDFFADLGGHSLLAARLMARVRAAFKIELPLLVLFGSPTIAGLAAEIEEAVLREVAALTDNTVRDFLETPLP